MLKYFTPPQATVVHALLPGLKASEVFSSGAFYSAWQEK